MFSVLSFIMSPRQLNPLVSVYEEGFFFFCYQQSCLTEMYTLLMKQDI